MLLGSGLLPPPAAARPSNAAGAVAPLPPELRDGRCEDLPLSSLITAIETQLPMLMPDISPPAADPAAAARATPPETRYPRLRQATLREYAERTLVPLLALARRGPRSFCRDLLRRFEFVRLTEAGGGHMTAYYHPVLPGSRSPSPAYPQPLYRRPPEPQSQLTTAAILGGGLSGGGFELVYVDSLYTALNIQIEGSATIKLQEGGEINLTPDGHNGHPYVNPLKLASRDGVVPRDQPTAPGQSRSQAFFRQHPEVLQKYWEQDAHFVFFKETPLRGSGRFGQLVTGRSIAVDATDVPLGALLWLRSEVATAAVGEAGSFAPIARLVLAQDTGAAIRGRGRIDLFVGSGPTAQVAASRTSRPAELFLILHKAKASRSRRRPASP
jgi:membrane-bound lytic murein transglycosylase A